VPEIPPKGLGSGKRSTCSKEKSALRAEMRNGIVRIKIILNWEGAAVGGV
jgi:hypothetical protein